MKPSFPNSLTRWRVLPRAASLVIFEGADFEFAFLSRDAALYGRKNPRPPAPNPSVSPFRATHPEK